MKTLFICLFLIPVLCYSQKDTLRGILPIIDGKVVYEKIIEVPGIKDSIYSKIKQSAAKIYSKLSVDDKETGLLVYNGMIKLYSHIDNKKGNPVYVESSEVWHNLNFYIKDNKVRVTATDIQATVDSKAESKYPVEIYIEMLIKTYTKGQAKMGATLGYKMLQEIDSTIKTIINRIEKEIKAKSEFDF